MRGAAGLTSKHRLPSGDASPCLWLGAPTLNSSSNFGRAAPGPRFFERPEERRVSR